MRGTCIHLSLSTKGDEAKIFILRKGLSDHRRLLEKNEHNAHVSDMEEDHMTQCNVLVDKSYIKIQDDLLATIP